MADLASKFLLLCIRNELPFIYRSVFTPLYATAYAIMNSMENLYFDKAGYFHVLVFYELFYKGNRKQFFPVFPYSYMQGRREKFCASSKKKCIGPYSSEKCIKGPHGSDKATSYRGARVANAVSALPFTSESEVNGRVYSWIGEHLGIAPG